MTKVRTSVIAAIGLLAAGLVAVAPASAGSLSAAKPVVIVDQSAGLHLAGNRRGGVERRHRWKHDGGGGYYRGGHGRHDGHGGYGKRYKKRYYGRYDDHGYGRHYKKKRHKTFKRGYYRGFEEGYSDGRFKRRHHAYRRHGYGGGIYFGRNHFKGGGFHFRY